MDLLTGYGDVCVRDDVIDWHAIIAEGRCRCEVIDETTLTIVDLETNTDDFQREADTKLGDTDG